MQHTVLNFFLKVAQKSQFVAWMFGDKQKQWCVFVGLEMFDKLRKDQNFLLRVMTGNETFV